MNQGRTIIFVALIGLITACATTHPGTELTKDGVSFSFYAPNAKIVTIAGNFNAWDTKTNGLTGPDKNGFWTIVVPLQKGRYEYLFLVDGRDWHPDPSVPEVDDGYGGKNSVLVVP